MVVRLYFFTWVTLFHVLCSNCCLIQRHGVVSQRLDPSEVSHLQTAPKCHIRHIYISTPKDYEMTCLQCDDLTRYLVLRYSPVIILAAKVTSCGCWLWLSITTLKPHSKDRWHHGVMYSMVDGHCIQINYLPDESVLDEIPCQQRNPPLMVYKFRSLNGWKKQKKSWETGIVRKLLEVGDVDTGACTTKRSLKEFYNPFTMDCLDCGDEFVVVIYKDRVKMAAAAVGTCRSRVLEDSIGVLPRDRDNPSLQRIQFDLQSGKCVMRGYSLQEGGGGYVGGSTTKCVYRHLYNMPGALSGYKNSWKTLKN